jgi:hypothetical protein
MPAQPSLDPATLSRAQGCLLGQFTDIGWLRILDGRPIDLTATEAAEAGRAAASFQHRPGSQSALLSCHRAPGTYGCVGPRRSARWAARRPAFRHRPGSPGSSIFWTNLYPVYVRGEAFLASREGTRAAAEFQKILDWPGVAVNEPIAALAHLGLARSYDLADDAPKSRAAYQDFLTLWKYSDPDVPVLIAAKAEYAKLQ